MAQPEAEALMPETAPLSIVDGHSSPLSLTSLHSELTKRGVEIPYSSLSQFVALGDIAEQLGVGGKGNRREFPRWSVDFLADFLPWYQTSKINKELAPDAVRHRMVQFSTSENSISRHPGTQISSSQNLKTQNGSTDIAFYEPDRRAMSTTDAALPVALEHLARAIQLLEKRQSPPPDRLLNAEEAAYLLCCGPGTVRSRVKPVMRGRYRESDVLRFIEKLGTEDMGEPKSGTSKKSGGTK